jgi:hypothetical protein
MKLPRFPARMLQQAAGRPNLLHPQLGTSFID